MKTKHNLDWKDSKFSIFKNNYEFTRSKENNLKNIYPIKKMSTEQ
jgi:hypothetical protein